MRYLLDTNTIIYFVNGDLPLSARTLIELSKPFLSFVTRVELFSWQGLQAEEETRLRQFITTSTIIGCSERIILQTIAVRKQHRLKVPDAFIAATALEHNFTLLSRNLKDFKGINGFTVIDPHTL